MSVIGSVNALFDLGLIDIQGSGGFRLAGIEDSRADTGFTEVLNNSAGQVDPTYVAAMMSRPMVSATLTEIETAITNGVFFDGFEFPQTTIITTVDLFFTQFDECATRLGGADHFRVRMNKGCIIPTQITATQDAEATMAFDIHAVFDGTNDPFVFGEGIALPATPSIDQKFTLGPAKINGTFLDALQGMTFDFGIEIIKQSSSGLVFPLFVAIQRRVPRFTFQTNDITALLDFGITGTPQSVTDSVVFLRKIQEGAARVADLTAEHISFTIDDGMIWVTNAGGSNNTPQVAEVILQPTFDGTNAVVVTSTTATIV